MFCRLGSITAERQVLTSVPSHDKTTCLAGRRFGVTLPYGCESDCSFSDEHLVTSASVLLLVSYSHSTTCPSLAAAMDLQRPPATSSSLLICVEVSFIDVSRQVRYLKCAPYQERYQDHPRCSPKLSSVHDMKNRHAVFFYVCLLTSCSQFPSESRLV
jgi:hypothetical protein